MKISHNLGVLLVTALLGGCFSAPVVSQQNTRSESVAVQQKQAKVYSATVSRVSDGDSLQVIDQHGRKRKLRFAYIDAPELQQAHGEASRKALQDVLGKQAERSIRADHYDIWVKPLADGRKAVACFNRADTPRTIELNSKTVEDLSLEQVYSLDSRSMENAANNIMVKQIECVVTNIIGD